MTENDIIKNHIEDCEHRIGNILGFMESNSDADISSCEQNISVLKAVIVALEEIQSYREIGTVKEIKIREAQFARLSEGYLSDLTSLREYQSIGTVEEFKALKEKAEPKKPIPLDKWGEYHECPVCGKYSENALGCRYLYCPNCGCKYDWGNE